MNLKRSIYPVVFLLGFAVMQAYPQSYTPIYGVKDANEYASVIAIYSKEDFNPDSVELADATWFNVDDTVMIYCVKGATIGTKHADSTYLPGDVGYDPGEDAQDPRNTGKYAFFLVTEKIGNTLVMNASLTSNSGTEGIFNMEPGEVAQLVKVRSYRYANVTAAGLTAPDWDPATGTGGIVALFVHGVLRLDGDIDVSGAGFKGAPGSTDVIYTNGCSSQDTVNYYEPFYLDNELWAGLKGEGTTDTLFHYTRGKASNINGGGGGNGFLSGGGGGSNASAGVRGGEESTICMGTPVSVTGGAGGFDLGRSGWYYDNGLPGNRGDRIFFGGGGGSGTRTATAVNTDGGDGGGIVVIVADTILGNGHWIRADGRDVSGTAVNGAAGGGGAGGCIILEVAGYQSTLNLSAIGGDGGNTTGSDTTGMGGAGGGGIYWMAGNTHPGVSAYDSTGTNGVFESVPPYSPLESPRKPKKQDNLVAPLRGFVFNPVPNELTYCSDVDPDPIITSEPKGGDGTYTYQWIDSSSTQNYWADISGATSRDYDPGLLSDTIYYRRIVSSAGLVDTSFRINVYVHPAIQNNLIAANDTVCKGNAPELFTSAATISGGPTGGTFTYKWQHKPDGAGSYSDRTAVSEEPTFQEVGLDTSTNYRRVAYAGVCVSISNEERVLVLETLTGNDITPNDTICINTAPDLISGPVPSNGDQGDIRYQWFSSTDPGNMGSLIPGETSISYQSPSLSQTTYIRRVVLSGNDDACRDTSAYVEILNVPDITNNTISASQTVCQEDQPTPLSGSSPGGGYLGQYSYTWISSTDSVIWVPAGGSNNVETDYNPGVMSGDTTWYQRVVGSGGQELVCKDTSNTVVINVLPSITNNVVTPADVALCQGEMPEALSGSLPGGGATVAGVDLTQAFRWEVAQTETTPGSGDWSHPSSGAESQNYTDPNQLVLDVDRWYQRIVFSGTAAQCVDTSNLVHQTVHSEITANTIDANQAICFNDSRALRETAPSGGEIGITPVYTWRTWLEGETSADATDIPGSDQQEYLSGPYTDAGTLIYFYDRVVEIGACRDTSNAMQVTVMQLPGGQLTDAGFDACEKDTVLQLDLNMDTLDAGHFAPLWSVYLKDGVHTGIGPGSVDMDLDTMGIIMDTEGADFATYTYELDSILYYPEGDSYACVAPPANLTGSPVVVNLARRPDPQILVDDVARESFKVCNDSALLQFIPDNGTMTRWSEPIGSLYFTPGTGQDEYLAIIPDNHDDYGEYRIFIRSEAGDCAGLDSMDLTFFEQPAPAVAGDSIVLWLASSVQLNADPPTAGVGTWTKTSGGSSFVDPNDPYTYVNDLDFGETEFTWTVRNGEDEGTCITSSDVVIVRRNEVLTYSGFSPNGDMDNEYFIMQGLVYANEFSISFFNSLGNTVRTINNRNVDQLEVDEGLINNGLQEDEMVVWDGRAENGNYVPSGTYYYVVTFGKDAVDFTYKGYVVVVRE